jgi:hypothetical protein
VSVVLFDDPELQAQAALDLWSSFPVNDDPRPLVINDFRVRSSGFSSAEAKSAYMAGAVESDVELVAGLMDLLRPDPRPFDGPSLRITAAALTVREFMTDRGPRQLPAWRLTIAGVAGPVTVFDPQVPDWWPSDWDERVSRHEGQQPAADVAADGHTLTCRFMGAAENEMTFPTADVYETPTAVMVLPTGQPVEPGPRSMLVAFERQVTVQLRRPLGNRFLINFVGQPVTALPSPPTPSGPPT